MEKITKKIGIATACAMGCFLILSFIFDIPLVITFLTTGALGAIGAFACLIADMW